MPDPNENFNAGYWGTSPPPSGAGGAQWTEGHLARQFSDQRNAQNNAAMSAQVPVEEFRAVASIATPYHWVNLPREAGRHISPLLGLPLALLVGVPLYHYTIPLWIALYPGAAVISALVAYVVFAGLGSGGGFTLEGRLVIGAIFGFVAGLPLTVAEQNRAIGKSYRHGRHFIRLALIFLWALYAQSLRESHPGIGWPPLKDTFASAFTPLHIVLAGAAVVVMHFWLWRD